MTVTAQFEIPPITDMMGCYVIRDGHGNLWRVDVTAGTMRRVEIEPPEPLFKARKKPKRK